MLNAAAQPKQRWYTQMGLAVESNLCFLANVNKMFYHQGIYVLYNRQLWCLWCILDGMLGFHSLSVSISLSLFFWMDGLSCSGYVNKAVDISFILNVLIIQNGSQKYSVKFAFIISIPQKYIYVRVRGGATTFFFLSFYFMKRTKTLLLVITFWRLNARLMTDSIFCSSTFLTFFFNWRIDKQKERKKQNLF